MVVSDTFKRKKPEAFSARGLSDLDLPGIPQDEGVDRRKSRKSVPESMLRIMHEKQGKDATTKGAFHRPTNRVRVSSTFEENLQTAQT